MPAPANDLTAARQRIASAYDPSALQAAGTRLMEVLAEHFHHVESRDAKVLNWNEPGEQVSEARRLMDDAASQVPLFFSEGPGEGSSTARLTSRLADLASDSVARGQNLHHPRYVGHQVPAPVPIAGLFDLVGAITNQCMAIYEMGPWATAVEHAVVGALGERLGFTASTFAGLVTSGGSLANLTGLLTARNVTLGDAWSTGIAGRSPPPVLVAQADAHYSVIRSAGILGLGTNQIVPAALDRRRRMDPDRLDVTLSDLRRRGIPVIAVSAAACATPIGAFDPLADIADVCARHEVWLHVDAAHGGALVFSERHRYLIAGIERADSVVCDAHKMMFMPALCAMLFYKNREHRIATFHQDAPYLFDPTAPELRDYDSGIVNLECTKRAAAFGLWGTWSLLGPQVFADMVDVTIDLAQKFHAMLAVADDFETIHEPQCNIVAFRFVPRELRDAPTEQIDAFQLQLRRTIIESGEFYFVQSRIDGRPVLRTTMMNPLTTEEDLHGLLDCLRRTAVTLL
jgi:L-2,4-diaminobutyrate decarboxylase